MTEAEYKNEIVRYVKNVLRGGDRNVVAEAYDFRDLVYRAMMEDYPPIREWYPDEVTDANELDYFDDIQDEIVEELEGWIEERTYWLSPEDWMCYIVGVGPSGEEPWYRFANAVEGTRDGNSEAYRHTLTSILVVEEYAALPHLPWKEDA